MATGEVWPGYEPHKSTDSRPIACVRAAAFAPCASHSGACVSVWLLLTVTAGHFRPSPPLSVSASSPGGWWRAALSAAFHPTPADGAAGCAVGWVVRRRSRPFPSILVVCR